MLQQTPVARVEPVWQRVAGRVAHARPPWPPRRGPTCCGPGASSATRAAPCGCTRRPRRSRSGTATSSRRDVDALEALPGVGAYTARAVAAFGYGRRCPVVDTNVRRVVARAVHGAGDAGPARVTRRPRRRRRAPARRRRARRGGLGRADGAGRGRLHGPGAALRRLPGAAVCAWSRPGRPEYAGPRKAVQAFAGTDRQVRGRLLDVLRDAPDRCARGARTRPGPTPRSATAAWTRCSSTASPSSSTTAASRCRPDRDGAAPSASGSTTRPPRELDGLRARVAAAGSPCRPTTRASPRRRGRRGARRPPATRWMPSCACSRCRRCGWPRWAPTAGRPDELVLAAVVDAELLAVHAAVHDALAGRVRGPVAAYLPGAWLPHCVLATSRPAEAFAALHPVAPVRARIVGVEVRIRRKAQRHPRRLLRAPRRRARGRRASDDRRASTTGRSPPPDGPAPLARQRRDRPSAPFERTLQASPALLRRLRDDPAGAEEALRRWAGTPTGACTGAVTSLVAWLL